MSYKLLILMIITAGLLGYLVGRLKIYIFFRTFSSDSSHGDSPSPDIEALENIDKNIDETVLDSVSNFYNNQMEEKFQSMIDNHNFEKNFYDHEQIALKGNIAIYTAVHALDKQTYMIKKIPLNKEGLLNNQIFNDISSLQKLNSKYIARYLTSWLEDIQYFDKFTEKNYKKIVVCIQMEVYTDRILKDWLGFGIDNKKPCCKIFKQLAKAVKHIHDKGISHGNLKSKHIYLDRSRNIKVTNFRLGKVYREDIKASQAQDIFDLAVILLELFSKFESKEHRKNEIRLLRDNHIISNELKENFDEVYKLIELMINQNDTQGIIEKVLKHQIVSDAI